MTKVVVTSALIAMSPSLSHASNTSGEISLQTPTVKESDNYTRRKTQAPKSNSDSESFLDLFSTKIKSWRYKKQCLNLQNNVSTIGAVTNEDWQDWLGKPKLKNTSGLEFLELDRQNENYFIRQTLVPSDKGSPRVNIRARLKAHRTYRISQRIFLEPGFDWGRKYQGGKLGFGFGGGTAPTGGKVQPDGFTARFMWLGNGDDTAHLIVYSYAADRAQNLPYGDGHPLDTFKVPIGEWFTLVMEVTANSAVDKADGAVKAWANGDQLLELNNIHWQSEGNQPAIQELIFSTFYGGNNIDWAPHNPTFIRFSDVCWAPVVDGYSTIIPEHQR